MNSVPAKSERKPKGGFARFWKRLRVFRWIGIGVIVVGLAAGGYAVYARSQAAAAASTSASTLQTALVRTGDLTIEATGAGTLVSANQQSIGFNINGNLSELDVQVGDAVTKGQVLARLDTSSLESTLAQAQATLQNLASPVALAKAQGDLVTAYTDMLSARNGVTYYLSEGVVYYEEAIAAAQQKLYDARLAEQLNPSSVNAQAVVDANDALIYAKTHLIYAQQDYEVTYLPKHFSGRCTDENTGHPYVCVIPPNDNVIQAAQATYTLAKANYQEAQYLVTALLGGKVPDDATGSELKALNDAKQAVVDAQANLDAAILTVPFDGTIMSVNGSVGSAVSGAFITIADLTKANLTIYMDETDWENVKVGYLAQATFDALPNDVFTGKVTLVYPALVSAGGTSMVQGVVALDEAPTVSTDPLPLGVSASVEVIAAQAKNVVLAPVEALHELSANSYAVFVMESGKPVLRTVTVGLQDGTYAEITSGLQAGETVTTGIMQTNP